MSNLFFIDFHSDLQIKETNLNPGQAVSRRYETNLSYTLSCLSHAVFALSVSYYILSCCNETDSVTKNSETSHLDMKQQSLVLVDYDRPVSFQIRSILFYGLLLSEDTSISCQDGNTAEQVWKLLQQDIERQCKLVFRWAEPQLRSRVRDGR